MQLLAALAAAFVVAWAVLVVVAQVLNPDQSPLTMGMSGLARGRAPWVMKSSFIVRGLSALLLVAALPADLRVARLVFAGVVLLWVWGVGSAALALADTDMPGEAPDSRRGGARPDRAGGVHRRRGRRDRPVASTMLHHAGLSGDRHLGAAHLDHRGRGAGGAVRRLRRGRARGAGRDAGRGRDSGAAGRSPPSPRRRPPSAARRRRPSAARGAGPGRSSAPAGARAARGAARRRAGTGALHDLASYAGLYQRLFVGLLMAWTLLVALGLLAS